MSAASENNGPRRAWLTQGWSRFAFANSATRREAKAILFQELAEATRHGMPLDEALATCMRTEGERISREGGRDASTRARVLQTLLAIAFIFLSIFGAFILLIFSSAWAADVERVARILAMRLLPLVRAGHSLSAAMEMLSGDYSKEEVEIIRAGEGWNQLPEALDRLGRFQYYERELQRHWARMAYPMTLAMMMLVVGIFVTIFIAPKYKDIFDQIGVELPASTDLMIDTGVTLMQLGLPVVGVIFLGIMFLYLLRLWMVGNRVLRDIMAGIIVVGSLALGLTLIYELTYNNAFQFDVITWIVVTIIALVLVLVLATGIVFGSEKLILWFERTAYRMFGAIPLIGAPRRTEREARWLASLSLALTSGTESADGIAAAGRICGGEIGRRSEQAAALVRQGYPIGDAVVQAQVLRTQWANRLRLLDGRAGYLGGVADIAEDAARESFHSLNRSSRVAEVLSVCLLGAIAGFFAYAMYMPIFQVPLVVGTMQ